MKKKYFIYIKNGLILDFSNLNFFIFFIFFSNFKFIFFSLFFQNKKKEKKKLMAATTTPEAKIDLQVEKVLDENEEEIRIGEFNAGAANRDNLKGNPLEKRLPEVAKSVNEANLHFLCILEAGRQSMHYKPSPEDPSKLVEVPGMTWTAMAAYIEHETDLTYLGLYRPNPSANPLCFALFANTSRVTLISASLKPMNLPNTLWKNAGRSMLNVTILVSNGNPQSDEFKEMNLTFFHFPMGLEDRLAASRAIGDEATNTRTNLLMGDANTFPDDGGPEMLKLMRVEDRIPKDCLRTFSAFPYDILTRPKEIYEEFFRSVPSKIIKVDDEAGTVTFIPDAVLDRVLCKHDIKVDVHLNPLASDHALIVAHYPLKYL